MTRNDTSGYRQVNDLLHEHFRLQWRQIWLRRKLPGEISCLLPLLPLSPHAPPVVPVCIVRCSEGGAGMLTPGHSRPPCQRNSFPVGIRF